MGVRRRSRPRRHVELGEDVAEVPLDRFLTQHQNVGDLMVAASRGHQSQHLHLPFGETAGSLASQEPVDLVSCRHRTHLSKGAAGNRKLRGC